jgi:hypothetical protein
MHLVRDNLCRAGCSGALVLAILLSVSAAYATGENAQVVRDFQARVTNYVDQRKKDAGSAPRPTNSPEKIAESRQDIASKTKMVRWNAKQGDIFTPVIAAYMRKRISAALAGPSGRKVRASLRGAEPVDGIHLRVNETYPQGVPMQSTPPSLLLKLPTLPDGLEYRIVGRNLVLRDTEPNIVVDFIPNAIPPV